MKELSREMKSSKFMIEETKMQEKVRAWLGRVSDSVQVFLLLRAKVWPELAGPRRREDLCHDRIHPWTDTHSWYVVMGGLAFDDTSPENLQFMPGDRSRLTLTWKAAIWTAKNRGHLLPDIPVQHIVDKSKSGGLGKFLTCWQATYFCAQCVFRLSRQYSISLLELNVFAHALCALMIFWIWWDKPQDVQEPTLITDSDGLDLCAFFSVNDHDPLSISSPIGSESRWIPCEPSWDAWGIDTPTAVTLYSPPESEDTRSESEDPQFESEDTQISTLLFGPYRQTRLRVTSTFWTIWKWSSLREREICELDSRCIQRLSRAYNYAKEDQNIPYTGASVIDRCVDFDWSGLEFLARLTRSALAMFRISSAMSNSPQLSRRSLRAAVGLTLAGGCYGGLHLTAWTCQFPSHAETMLWRAAGITITLTGPSVIAYALCTAVLDWIKRFVLNRSVLDQRRAQRIQFIHDTFRFLKDSIGRHIAWIWGAWYIFCRAFIVIECFIMLAQLPDTTLEIPRWAVYTPHVN
jgi:hypothetical protein